MLNWKKNPNRTKIHNPTPPRDDSPVGDTLDFFYVYANITKDTQLDAIILLFKNVGPRHPGFTLHFLIINFTKLLGLTAGFGVKN